MLHDDKPRHCVLARRRGANCRPNFAQLLNDVFGADAAPTPFQNLRRACQTLPSSTTYSSPSIRLMDHTTQEDGPQRRRYRRNQAGWVFFDVSLVFVDDCCVFAIFVTFSFLLHFARSASYWCHFCYFLPFCTQRVSFSSQVLARSRSRPLPHTIARSWGYFPPVITQATLIAVHPDRPPILFIYGRLFLARPQPLPRKAMECFFCAEDQHQLPHRSQRSPPHPVPLSQRTLFRIWRASRRCRLLADEQQGQCHFRHLDNHHAAFFMGNQYAIQDVAADRWHRIMRRAQMSQ